VKEPLLLAATSALFVLASVATVVFVVVSGSLLTFDGLTLVFVALLCVLAFSWFALSALKEGREAKPPKSADAGSPPAQASGEKPA
jgi:hypothetical protein